MGYGDETVVVGVSVLLLLYLASVYSCTASVYLCIFLYSVSMSLYISVQRQYIFIHDTLLENINMGDTEVTIQNLRGHFKKLQAHDPKTDSSLIEKEYLVSGWVPGHGDTEAMHNEWVGVVVL